ncbi:GntR family transcriptional regulator [Rhodococcus sp. NPDC057014]|uniref:GntR family transcriptional regulator n=1 Tax=Rhodococcus sp. NPDC057014 TaxID=3346000 RepID=UPI00362CC7AB
MDMQAPNRPSLYDEMLRDITTGEFSDGERLVELALAERYGVSRTPVREALRKLEQEGLAVRGSRGLEVKRQSLQDLLEIFQVRVPLESVAAEIAAARHDTRDEITLRRILARMHELGDDSVSEQAAENLRLHGAIWNATHNSALIDTLERLTSQLGRYPLSTYGYPGRWQDALAEHEALIEAILAGRAEQAGELARTHMQEARDTRIAMWPGD